MCLITLAYHIHPRYPLVLAANRDEFLDRPTSPAHWWPDATHLLAGRDLRAGGTWMGITRQGRFAALTNHRDLRRPKKEGPSRGLLVRAVLEHTPDLGSSADHEGFNLLYGTVHALHYHSNVELVDRPLAAGIHGLSNAFLNTAWPKVERAKRGLEQALDLPDALLTDALFAFLLDDARPPDDRLPRTGLSMEQERAVSSVFIDTPGYGTRCSTVVLVDHQGIVHFHERTWPGGGTVSETFLLQ